MFSADTRGYVPVGYVLELYVCKVVPSFSSLHLPGQFSLCEQRRPDTDFSIFTFTQLFFCAFIILYVL